jgi:hypothetical protein
MNEVIMARLRGVKPTFRVLFKGDSLPDIGLVAPLSLETAKPYAPLQGKESEFDLYYVELDQDQKEKMIEPYIDAVNAGTDQASQLEYNVVNAIYKKSGRRLVLSRVNSGSKIAENGRTILSFNEKSINASKLSFAIDFSGEVDAYYDGADRIYFSKFSRAKSLFRDFDEFYQEAWYEDKESFLDSDLFAVSEIEPEDIGTAETNKISEIRNNIHLNLEDEGTIAKIQAYARRYPLSGVVLNADGRIKITTKADLKCAINLLTRRYYTSEVTGEILQARGIEKMKDQKAKKIVDGVEVLGKADNR